MIITHAQFARKWV